MDVPQKLMKKMSDHESSCVTPETIFSILLTFELNLNVCYKTRDIFIHKLYQVHFRYTATCDYDCC